MQNIKIMIPCCAEKEVEKIIRKAQKYIPKFSCEYGEPYNKTFRHYAGEGQIIKQSHRVKDIILSIPDENEWDLIATVKDGALFVTDQNKKLVLTNEKHGVGYGLCDACKHKQRKASFIVRNNRTGEELQVGSECAKKFGIGTVQQIYNLTSSLYQSYALPYYEGWEEPKMWPHKYNDPYAARSVEVSLMVQAAKKYYDDHNGLWKKSYVGPTGVYYRSESAADISGSLDDFQPDDQNPYYLELMEWLRNEFETSEEYGFNRDIKELPNQYYVSASYSAIAFFAIKNYEVWKKEKAAREAGIYLPKRDDYIRIVGKVVNKITRNGYYGSYTEYDIQNNIDNNIYKRAGALPLNSEGLVDGYAFINDVWKGNYTLGRVTKGRKKGVEIANIFTK